MPSVLNTQSSKKTFTKAIRYDGKPATITAVVRYDDTCRNGHNTFAITGDIRSEGKDIMGGCIHEELAKHFPELAPYIKWHLCSSDGPMHYVANTVYLAGDRDYNGLRKGEPDPNPRLMRHFARVGSSPFQHEASPAMWAFISDRPEGHVFKLVEVSDPSGKWAPHYYFKGMTPLGYYRCPLESKKAAFAWVEALNSCIINWNHEPGRIGEGKERQLDAARNVAIWPEATDDELCSDTLVLTALLEARLPQLLAEFEQAVTELGFVF